MRKKIIYHRSIESIVQQTNVQTTKDVLKQLFSGNVQIDLNPGSSPRSFDFDDQTKVDFDKPQFEGFSNLIDQAVNKQKLFEHLNPPAPAVDPAPVPEPAPAVDPAPVE